MRRGAGGNGKRPPVNESAEDLDRRLAFFPLTDLGNAERFRERWRGRLIFTEAAGWYWWTGKVWSRQGADGEVRKAAHLTVRSIQDEAAAIRGTGDDAVVGEKGREPILLSDLIAGWGRDSETNPRLNGLAKQASSYLEVNPADLDADPFCINCGNGTLFVRRPDDLRMTQPLPARAANIEPNGYLYFLPHDPSDFCTKITTVDYVREASCNKFIDALSFVQPDPAMRRQLAAWKGYSLTGDISEQVLCVFHGTGKNGKTVFEDTTGYVAGEYCGTTPIETFLDQGRARNAGQATPDLAELLGVRMLRTSEPKRGARLDEGLIKLVTGGDPIDARHLNKPYFRFYPEFKLTLSVNPLPVIRGTDEGIWRRIVRVPWAKQVPAEKRDRHLTRKLRAEASGILNWMLDGLCDWLDNGLVLTKETEEATAEYRRRVDQLGQFLDACTVHDQDAKVQSSVLHEVFNAWSVANAHNPWSGKAFSEAMKDRGYADKKISVMFFVGLRLVCQVSDFLDSNGRPLRSDDDD